MPDAPLTDWAAYGLNPDGTPLDPKAAAPKPEDKKSDAPAALDTTAELAAVKTKLAEAEAKLSKLPADFEGMTKKLELVDKIVKSISGESAADLEAAKRKEIFEDLKRISPPGVRKVFELLEADPEAVDKLTGTVGSLTMDKLTSLNTRAHEQVMEMATKAGFKAGTPAEMAEMVFPFERAITDVINSNETLKKRFVAGDLGVVEEVFTRIAKPFVSQRLREKQARMANNPLAPKAPPKGSAQPGATEDDKSKGKPDIRTPKGRAEFHKQAFARFASKAFSRDEE